MYFLPVIHSASSKARESSLGGMAINSLNGDSSEKFGSFFGGGLNVPSDGPFSMSVSDHYSLRQPNSDQSTSTYRSYGGPSSSGRTLSTSSEGDVMDRLRTASPETARRRSFDLDLISNEQSNDLEYRYRPSTSTRYSPDYLSSPKTSHVVKESSSTNIRPSPPYSPSKTIRLSPTYSSSLSSRYPQEYTALHDPFFPESSFTLSTRSAPEFSASIRKPQECSNPNATSRGTESPTSLTHRLRSEYPLLALEELAKRAESPVSLCTISSTGESDLSETDVARLSIVDVDVISTESDSSTRVLVPKSTGGQTKKSRPDSRGAVKNKTEPMIVKVESRKGNSGPVQGSR